MNFDNVMLFIAIIAFWYAAYKYVIYRYNRHVVDIAIDHLSEMTVAQKARLAEALLKLLPIPDAPHHIFTFQDAVVTYAPHDIQGFNYAVVEESIKKILTAYPGADLTKHETALGVKIIDVQRKTTPPSQPTHDMPIGKWE